MTTTFFRHLEERHVRWLLISGQATILYGAATFSEDIDLWLEPTADNIERFRAALRASNARYYKLTPALSYENAIFGHGFHFVVPDLDGGADWFLDVMTCPPRVRPFNEAVADARYFDTDWGRLLTVGVHDLVELKKTQRPRDYPIISRLAISWLEEQPRPWSAKAVQWTLDHLFSLPELERLFQSHPDIVKTWPQAMPPLIHRAAMELSQSQQLDPGLEDELESWFDERTAPLRRADRHFWRRIINELKRLREAAMLTPEGAPVR